MTKNGPRDLTNDVPSDLQKLADALSKCGYGEPKVSEKPISLPLYNSVFVALSPGTYVFTVQQPQKGAPAPDIHYDPNRDGGLVCYRVPGNFGDANLTINAANLGSCVKTSVSQFLRYDINRQCVGVPDDTARRKGASGRILSRGLRALRLVGARPQ